MFRPQGGPEQVNGSAVRKQEINSQIHPGDEKFEEEQPVKYSMWPNRSGPDLTMSGRQASGVTNENTPRYVEHLSYFKSEIPPPLGGEETNYTFSSVGTSSNTEQQQDTSSHALNAASLGLAALHIEDKISVDSWIASGRGNLSNPSEYTSWDSSVIPSGSSTVHCNDQPVARESSACDHDGHSKTENTIIGDGLGTVNQVTSVPRFEEPQSVPKDSQPEVPPAQIFDLSHDTVLTEDTCSEGSLMPDTDADSVTDRPVGGPLPTARYSLEEQGVSVFPTYNSQWIAKYITCTGRKGDASTSTTTSRSANHSNRTSSSSNHSHKQRLSKGDDSTADGDDDPPVRPESDISGPQDVKSRDKFPCPFHAYDPVKYNSADYHTCATTRWDSIARLKDHLSRFHLTRVKQRWRGASPREKWNRIYGILFPDEAVRTPCKFASADTDSNYAPAIPLSPSQLQYIPGLEKPDWRKLRCDLRTCLDRSTNDCIRSLPDEAKAQIVKELVEKCVIRLTWSKTSPSETPRMLAPPGQYQLGSQVSAVDEQAMETSIENWDSSGGESSNQGLGLDWPSTGPFSDTRSFFDEQYPAVEDSDMNQFFD